MESNIVTTHAELDAMQAAADASLTELTTPQIPLFKCRASAAGKIMTNPRSKSETLSETCKTHLKEWVISQLYGGRKEFTSKQTDKGIKVEHDAIIYASCHIPDMGLCSKNTEQIWNDWFTGEPDVLIDGFVPDIKSSYTQFTFPLLETELPESGYDWQVVVYADILQKKEGRVIYVLMSMPEEMIAKEARWKLPEGYTLEQYEDFAQQFRYDHLPPHLRIKEFEVEITQEKINAIRQRVEDCRAYIETVLLPEVEKNRLKYQD